MQYILVHGACQGGWCWEFLAEARTYIVCEEDRDVYISTQLSIVQNYPCRVVSMKSGHFPFLSQPKQLADILTL